MTRINVDKEIAAGRAMLAKLPGAVDFAVVGSAAYCQKPHDVDFVVLVASRSRLADLAKALCGSGWRDCGAYGIGGRVGDCWHTVRRGNLNLILTDSRRFFDGFVLSTEVCKVLRLESREDRVAVHDVVRDRKPASEVRP